MKNSKVLRVVLIIIDVLYFLGMMYLGFMCGENLPSSIYDLSEEVFLIVFPLLMIVYLLLFYLFNFISIILHECGHLLFGLFAKLKFISFTIWNISFVKEKDKIEIKKRNAIPGIGGYCVMVTEDKKKYPKDKIMYFYLGGIMFNLILAIIALIGVFFVENSLGELIFWLFFGINTYYALYNIVPAVNVSGNVSDTLHLINYFEDDNYMNVMSNIQIVQDMLAKGIELKDVDPKYLNQPKVFRNNSDVLSGLIYTDYLSAKDKYKENIEYCNLMLDKCGDKLSKQEVITLKLQIINALFFLNKPIEEIKKIWDKDIKKYLDTMYVVAPVFICFNYMYALLVEKNSEEADKYLEQYNKLNRKRYDAYLLKEADEYMVEIVKRKED